MQEFEISPNVDDARYSRKLGGWDHTGNETEVDVIEERPMTLWLNKTEVITIMTVGDHPKELAVGFLLNQNMLQPEDEVTDIEYHDDIATVVVRTTGEASYEQKLQRKIRTSGCAQGTVFGDIMEKFDAVTLPDDAVLKTSWLYNLFYKINHQPSLYLKAGAIHGCVLCQQDRPLIYMEDVGRHNAVDKIAGYMYLNDVAAEDKIFFTTGRLTSEMVIKTVQMGIPILLSRSGFTAWGVELARQANLTLIGRAKGKRFQLLSGEQRLVFDANPDVVAPESRRHQRKGADSQEAG
jgi:FdhD protein